MSDCLWVSQNLSADDYLQWLLAKVWYSNRSAPRTLTVTLVANFAAYTFAPPILVTPLGALSVLIGYASEPKRPTAEPHTYPINQRGLGVVLTKRRARSYRKGWMHVMLAWIIDHCSPRPRRQGDHHCGRDSPLRSPTR